MLGPLQTTGIYPKAAFGKTLCSFSIVRATQVLPGHERGSSDPKEQCLCLSIFPKHLGGKRQWKEFFRSKPVGISSHFSPVIGCQFINMNVKLWIFARYCRLAESRPTSFLKSTKRILKTKRISQVPLQIGVVMCFDVAQ